MNFKHVWLILLTLLSVCSPLRAMERAANSVLASGTWRKVSVSASGIYCLTPSDLAAMGFSDPSKVRVYGAGGRHLAFAAGKDERDDLYPIPALHTSQGVLFYAEGPDSWTCSTSGTYSADFNPYSRYAYYYLTTGDVSDSPSVAETPSAESSLTISTYDNLYVYAPRDLNIGKMGRRWFYSKACSSSASSLSVSPSMSCVAGSTVRLSLELASKLQKSNSVSVDVDGSQVLSSSVSSNTSITSNYSTCNLSTSFSAESDAVSTVKLQFGFSATTEAVYLGCLTLSTRAPLAMPSSQLLFRTTEQRAASGAVTFTIENATSDLVVWDVTSPWAIKECQTSVFSGTATFNAKAGALYEYVAFSPSGSFPSPTDCGAVSCQNLHAHSSVNYLVVTNSTYKSYAQRLCDIHARQGLSTRVVDVDEIFEEFSAGRPEAMAVRDYIKMIYDRGLGSVNGLQNVLLFGSGSYDNFDRSSNTNVVPTYQSLASDDIVLSYCTDDFFGWLDDGEGGSDLNNTVDVGLGRIPCVTTSQAETYVSKVEAYVNSPTQGNWRSKAVFIGQSGDSNEHQGYAIRQSSNFEDENPDMDVVRVFSESFDRVVTSTGSTYPKAVALARNYMQSGCSLLHFTGHGGASSSGEGYFDSDYLANLTNGGKEFILVAATCVMGPFDYQPENCSSVAIFNPDGGAIAVLSATRETYGNGNYTTTRSFCKNAYSKKSDGEPYSMGYAFRQSKNVSSYSINALKYVLFGDPALTVSIPTQLYAQLDSVNGVAADEVTEPIKALENCVLQGSIRNSDGSLCSSFSGKAVVSLYDKRVERQTSGVASGTSISYDEWGAKLFSGEVEVANGEYTTSFILSKEFDLSVGYGRLTAYASASDGRDAMGATDQILVGGFSDDSMDDDQGPVISAWVDYERDDNDNIIGSTPILYAVISDEQGVNISGQGVGHDISLVLNGDRTSAVSLNDYFQYEEGSHTSGLVSYPLSLAGNQEVSLTIKAWDNLNNSSEETINVNLSESTDIAISGHASIANGCLYLYFSSNAIGDRLSVRSRLYSLTGQLMLLSDLKTPQRNGQGSYSAQIQTGVLPSGVYVLKVDIESNGKNGTLSRKIFVKAQ